MHVATVVGGVGTYAKITTNNNLAVLDWKEFGNNTLGGADGAANAMLIAAGQTLEFQLPSASSAVLNRVSTAASPTTIAGTIISNGKFFLINPSGITVASTGNITAPSIILTTAEEADSASSYNYYKSYGTLKQISTPVAGAAAISVKKGAAATLTTTGNSGDIYVIGSTAQVAGTINGNLFVNSSAAGAAAVILGEAAADYGATGTASGLTTAGNLIVAASGTGQIQIGQAAAANAVTVGGNASFSTTNSAIVMGGVAGNTLVVNGSGKTVTFNSGTADLGAVATPILGDFKSVVITKAGNAYVTDNASDVALGASETVTDLVVSSAGKITSSGAVKVGGKVSLTAVTSAVFQGNGAITVDTLNTPDTTVSTDGNLTINDGAKITGAGAQKLTFSSGGDIVQNAGTGGIATSSAVSLTASGSSSKIDLTAAVNNITGQIKISGAASSTNGAKIDNSTAATTIIGASSVTGPTEIKGTAIQLGNAAADVLSFSKLKLTSGAGSAITDASDSVTVSGALTLNTAAGAGTVTLDNAGNKFGSITGGFVGTGLVKIVEADDTVVDGLVLGGALDLKSAGNISGVNTAAGNKLSVAGTTKLVTGATSSITLTNDANVFTGAITVDDNTANISINDTVSTSLTVTAGKSASGNTTITQKTDSTNVTLNGDFNVVSATVNTSGAGTGFLAITDANNITLKNIAIQGTATNLTTNATVTVTATNGVISVDSGFNSATPMLAAATSYFPQVTLTANGANGAIATIGDAAVQVTGNAKFVSNNGITLNGAGNKFGSVVLNTGNNGSATLIEDDSTLVKSISINGSGSLSLTTVGATSDITQSANAGDRIVANGAGGTVSITSGRDINLNHTYNNVLDVGNDIAKALNLTSTRDAIYKAGQSDIKLGQVWVGRDLTVDTSGSLGNNAFVPIGQDAAGKIWVYGATNLTSFNTTIDLSGTGNNFGPLYVSSGTGDVKVTEAATLNIRKGTVNGNMTLVSEAGDIVDNNLNSSGAVVVGDVITADASGKVVSFTAAKGSVTINSATAAGVPVNSFRGLAVSALNDSTVISNGTQAITLQASTAVTAGGLSITSTGKDIDSTGKISIFGASTFNAGTTGKVTLTNTSNTFGVLKIVGTDVSVYEASGINLSPASIITGTASFTSDDVIVTNGTGVVSFTKTGANGTSAWDLTLKAANGITLSSGWSVAGKLKLDSSKLDLSAVSLVGNLGGNTPTLATGAAYITDGSPKP
jgi:hypothetical protein